MSTLENKIDFSLVIRVKNANPNGDPLNGNRPRVDYEGIGEITDVCLKRKIRDRMLERYQSLNDKQKEGQAVFVQSDDRNIDGEPSLRARAESDEHGLGKKAFSGKTNKEEAAKNACKRWFDVRAFGQVFAFKASKKKKGNQSKEENSGASTSDADGVSIPIRGPVTIQSAFSVEPIASTSTQITKSVSGEGDGTKRGSDTMGMKHRVDSGIYVTFGAMNPQLAERTGFSEDDAQSIKEILSKLFENDASTARPEGSMEVLKVIWWKHNCRSGQYSSAKVHGSLTVSPDGTIKTNDLEGLKPEVIEGF